MAGAAGREPVERTLGAALAYAITPGGRLEHLATREALERQLGSGRGQLWLDIDSRSEEEWSLLSDVFRFHPLAIEDTRSPESRIKVEEYEGYLFVVARAVRFATWTPEPYDITSFNAYLFLGRDYLVTVHGEALRAVETVAARVEAAPELMARGVDHVAYMLLDTLVDFYFPLLDEIDTFVDELEERIFHQHGTDTMARIFDLKRSLLALRRHLAPMREVTATLANRPSAYLRPETQIYFRDVHDHVVRQVESVETFRDILSAAMDGYLSSVSNRMNEVIKALSVIATIVLPPTLVASVYGMNFAWMPGLNHPWGFWLALLVMALISGGFILYMWWKRWL